MQTDKMEELLINLSTQMSAMQKDIESIKSEMHSNYIRSDENDSAMHNLLDERTQWAKNRQDAVKAELQGQIDLVKKENELQSKQIAIFETRIKNLEEVESKKIMTRWNQIKDKIFYGILIVLGYAVITILNLHIPPRPM